jgi:endonuclease YncB( thermonuclease family)
MKKVTSFILTAILLISIFPQSSSAHNGAKDELGGHFRNADCMYLLHSPTALVKTAKTKNDLMTLIQKNNTNKKCVAALTVDKIELEGYELPTGKVTKPTTKATTVSGFTLNKKYTATLAKCTDGDTANFKINGKIYKTRFLFIDTPESTTQVEPFGKEASNFTCNALKKAKKIILETDGKDVYDKYDRLLAWVWLDGKLHQENITKAGLVEGYYDYGTYKYEQKVRSAMSFAQKNKKGIYNK